MSGPWYQFIVEVIDLRSFSNLWFWIGLAVVWVWAGQRVLGVPVELISRAKRHGGHDGGQDRHDMETLLHINARRYVQGVEAAGVWLVALICFLLSGFLILAIFYRVEFAQAVLLLGGPMLVLRLLSWRLAQAVLAGDERGADLDRRLAQHRATVQLLGMISILITSMYGMWLNLMLGVLR